MPALEELATTAASVAPARVAPSLYIARRAPSRAVVVHSGGRDGYQLALALAGAGLLEKLVTDLYWSEDGAVTRALSRILPARLLSLLRRRNAAGLAQSQVKLCPAAGLAGLALDRLTRVPFAIRQRITRGSDAHLGRVAGELAKRARTGLVSYSYYGYDAFRAYGRAGMLFQVHPHPATMRRILREELELHPECAASLKQEWELALPEEDFEHLTRETRMASHFLAASSFTRDSLVEHGVRSEAITVVPYGVDLQRFKPDPTRQPSRQGRLQLLFVGRINQRKGMKYLLEALRLLRTDSVELTICGRVLDDLTLFRPFASQVKIRPSVSAADLVRAYQSADLFLFPSIGEGFGHVLLEALASGLPILSTTHTAAPDLIQDGAQGFIVEPRRPDLLAERIEWALTHRNELAEMRSAARACAETFTWERFRRDAAQAVRSSLAETSRSHNGRERSHV
jgi:glycosyltransferase involved in cell wall biosynthesis